MPNKKIRACYLGRVSTTYESQESSLVNQKDIICEFIQAQKDEEFNPLLDCFEDTISGTKLIKNNQNDKGYDALMEYLNIEIVEVNNQDYVEVSIHLDKTKQPRYNKIYCKSTSRISRSGCRGQSLLEILKLNGIEVYFYDLHKSTFTMSDLELTMYSFMDNQYAKSMSYNTRNNKVIKTRNRELMLHNVRFGWDLIKKNTKRYYVKNEEEYKILRLIIKLLLEEDKGCSLIEQELAAQGLTSSKIKLDKCNINRILKDKHYLGLEKYYDYPDDYTSAFMVGRDYLKSINFQWLPCSYIDPLITQEEYDLIQDKLQSRANCGRGFRNPYKPLSRKLVCACCGEHYYSLGDKNYFKISSYKCSSKRSTNTKKSCNNNTLYMDFFDEWIDKLSKDFRVRVSEVYKKNIDNVLNLRHHLALLLAQDSFDKLEVLLDREEELKEKIKNIIAPLIANSSDETMDIILEFQREIQKELKDTRVKIDTYLSLKEEVVSAIKEVIELEKQLDKLEDNLKDSYTREDVLEELEKIYVYPDSITKRKRNNIILIPILKIESQIFDLFEKLLRSSSINLLDNGIIRRSEVQYTKRYIVKEVTNEQLKESIQVLKSLNLFEV